MGADVPILRYMTAEPVRPGPVNPGHDPAAIRSILPPEDRADFERLYAEALDEAKRTFSLDPVTALLEQWRRIAIFKQSPGHAGALEHGRRFLAGEDVPFVRIDLDALLNG
jgi:hypothetical protein